MMCCLSCLTLLLSLPLVLVSSIDTLFVSPTPDVTNEDITTICSRTQDPSFCWRVIKSNPEASRTNLQGLAAYTIDAALANAYESYNTIDLILKEMNDDKLQVGYTQCSKSYFGAVEDLKSAKRLLAEADYRAVRILALSSAEEAKTCERELAIPPAQPSPLRQRNDNLKRYGSVIWAISNRLIRFSG